MADVIGWVVKGFKFVGVVIVAFFESITLSFYGNVKKRYKKEVTGGREHYYQVKVPEGYKSAANEPEFKDLSANNDFSDFTGLPKI